MLLVRGVLKIVLVLVLLVALYVAGAALRLYGEHEDAGELTEVRVPDAVVETRTRKQALAVNALDDSEEGRNDSYGVANILVLGAGGILFGLAIIGTFLPA